MAQEQIQEQRLTQQQKLTQGITQQQLLQAQLTELPITQLMERVNAEMDDNPALEISADEPLDNLDPLDNPDNSQSEADSYEKEERQSALDEAFESLGRDDEDLPVYHGGMSSQDEREEMVYGQAESFYDQIKEQMDMTDLTEEEKGVMEYLIGSLDDDGLLRKPLHSISDELAIYHNIDMNEAGILHVLRKLQQFDPPGIGARSLQECLLLQIERRDPSKLKDLMQKTVENYFELFTKKHWDKLQQQLQLTDVQTVLRRSHHGSEVLIRVNGLEKEVGGDIEHVHPIVRVGQRGIGPVDRLRGLHEPLQLGAAQRFAYICVAGDIGVGGNEGLQLEHVGQMVDAKLPRYGQHLGVGVEIVVGTAQQTCIAARSRRQAVIAVCQSIVERHLLGIIASQTLARLLHIGQQVLHHRFGVGGEGGAGRRGHRAVPIVVVQRQRSDEILHLCIGIEIVVRLAFQHF